MNNTILSIIIPMYNSEKFIKKALDSLVANPCNTLEVLVVNDGSTDSSPDIVRKYEAKYPNMIRLINQANNGHGSTINHAIKECKGRYFRVLDADDWLKPLALQKFIAEICDIDSDVIITGYYTYNIQSHKEELHNINTSITCSPTTFHELSQNWYNVINGFTLHGITYSTSFYRSLPYKLPEKIYYDDACYVTLFSRHAKSITLLDTPVYVYRIGDVTQSVSDSSRVKRIDQLEKIISELMTPASTQLCEDAILFSNKKALSVISDYLITALILYPNRKIGRKKAKEFKSGIKNKNEKFYFSILKRYYVLLVFNLLQFNNTVFKKIINIFNNIKIHQN